MFWQKWFYNGSNWFFCFYFQVKNQFCRFWLNPKANIYKSKHFNKGQVRWFISFLCRSVAWSIMMFYVCLSVYIRTLSSHTTTPTILCAAIYSHLPTSACSLLRAFGSLSSMHFLKKKTKQDCLLVIISLWSAANRRTSSLMVTESDTGSKDGSNYSGSGPKSTKKLWGLHRIQQFIHQTSAEKHHWASKHTDWLKHLIITV